MPSVSSSFAFQALMNKSLLDLQRELARAQQEITTGRHSDLSVVAGADVGRDVSLGQNLSDITAITQTNKHVTARLDASDAALSSIKTDASSLRADLLRALTDGGNLPTIVLKATTALNSLVANMNSTLGGEYIFAGTNLDTAPIRPFSTQPPSAAKTSIDAAFQAEFGFLPDDPAAGSISASDMKAFLEGPWSGLYDEADWKGDWSTASDDRLQARISLTKNIDASVTANDPAIRNLIAGYVALTQMPLEQLTPDAANAVISSALNLIDEGMSGVNQMQANIGGMKANIITETTTLSLQQDYLGEQIRAIEAVDSTETAARLNSLMTQLETAYTLTSKLQQLSLTKYL